MSKGSSASHSKAEGSSSTSRSRLSSRKISRDKGGLTWAQADQEKLHLLITWATEEGALVSFSKVTGGGALVLFIKDGQDVAKEYAASEQELDLLLDDLTDTYHPG